nr:MAG TPA: PcfJ like protein [Caudoviricetes sp.]
MVNEKERVAQLERLAPKLTAQEMEQVNDLFRHFIFKRSGKGEIWTTCCRRHEFIKDTTDNACELRILDAPHAPERRNNYDNTPGWQRRETCPYCGREVTVKELRYSGRRRALWEYQRAVVLRQWRGALWATAWDCFKDYEGKEPVTNAPVLTMLPKAKLLGAYRFTPGKVEAATRVWWSDGPFDYSYQDTPGKNAGHKGGMWHIHSPYGFCSELGKNYDMIGLPELQKSALRWCRLEQVRIASDDFIELLTAACFYPKQVEWLVKLGLQDAVRDLAGRGVKNAAAVKWNANTPAAFLGCGVKELDAITKESDCPVVALRIYRALHDMTQAPTPEECAALADCADDRTLRVLLPRMKRYGLRIPKLISYLEKIRRHGKIHWSNNAALSAYADYITAADGCGLDLSNTIHLLPRDFWEKHDTVTAAWSAICANRRNSEANAKYKARLPKLTARYLYWSDTLLIRAPVNAGEIVEEGKRLEHCVGGYADRHLSGKTTILFLRRRDKPHVPLVTIEMDGNTIRQVYGYRNDCARCPENPKGIPARKLYGVFLDEWLEWLNAGSKRYKDGRPKLPRKKHKEDVA